MNPRYSNLTFPPTLWSFALDGSCQTNLLNFGNYTQVAVGNVAAAAGDEVIVGDDVVSSDWRGPSQIKIFPANGTAPITTFPSIPESLWDTTVTLADLNGDGAPEFSPWELTCRQLEPALRLDRQRDLGQQQLPHRRVGRPDTLRWIDGFA